MNKRGQFFLVAAFVIVGIILGLTSTINYTKLQQDRESFYDQAEEVEHETKQVIDYGVYYSKDTRKTVTDFLYTYKDQIGQDDALFIYKSDLDFYALFFDETNIGSISLLGGTANSCGQNCKVIPINKKTGKEIQVIVDGNKILAEIDGRKHVFIAREGYNLFYSLSKDEDGGERLVASGG